MNISRTLTATLTITLMLLANSSTAQVVWMENFDGQTGKGIIGGNPPVTNMTGITKWSVETTVPFYTNVQKFVVISNSLKGAIFDANDVKDECIWRSELIDISSNDFVDITADLSEVGNLAKNDFIRTYYSVNGQADTLFYENGNLMDDFTEAVARQEAVVGSNLVITIKANNGSKSNHHRFDNITVTASTPVSNQVPELAVSPPGNSKSVVAEIPITFDLTATEEYLDRNDIITLKMTTNPGGATFAETNGTTELTGTFSWTPDTAGDYTAIFEASDKDGTNTVQVDIKVYPGKKTVWLEDFDDPAIDGKGAFGPSNIVDLAGVTNWTVDVTNTELTASTDYFKVQNDRFEARDLDGEAVWVSTNIDISAYASVSAEVDIDYAGGAENSDYIRTYYSLNGGPNILFEKNGDLTDDFNAPVVAKQDKLSGSTLAIIIRCDNNAGAEGYYFDNVKVSTPIPSGMIMTIR